MSNCDCGARELSEVLSGTTDNHTFDFGEAVYVWGVDLVQGTTPVGSTADINIQVNRTKQDILDFDNAEANATQSRAPARQTNAAATPTAGISGTAVPWYIPDGKIYAVIADGAASGSVTVYVLASSCPPPWR